MDGKISEKLKILLSHFPHLFFLFLCKVPYPEGTLYLAWWSFLGDYGDSFHVFRESYFGMALLGGYVILSQMLLANLLIAIMTDSYGDVRENSDSEWKFNRFAFLDQYITTNILPPPFNLVTWLYSLIFNFFSSSSSDETHATDLKDIDITRLEAKREEVLEYRERKEKSKTRRLLKDVTQKLDTILTNQRTMEMKIIQLENEINARKRESQDH
jgi:hypothetical protein